MLGRGGLLGASAAQNARSDIDEQSGAAPLHEIGGALLGGAAPQPTGGASALAAAPSGNTSLGATKPSGPGRPTGPSRQLAR